MFTLVVDTLRGSLRSLRAAPGFVCLATATIGLGVGLTTGIFSVVNAVLLRPLPYADPDRLVAVGRTRGTTTTLSGISEPEILDWRERATSFQALEFTARSAFVLRTDPAAEWVTGARASHGLLDSLGVHPLLGRNLRAGDEQGGRSNVSLISERLWRSRFSADPNIIGRQVRLSENGADESASCEIVGVLPSNIPLNYSAHYDIVMPFVFSGVSRASGARRASELQVIGRLAPGVSVEKAATEMRALAERLNRDYPMGVRDASVGVQPLHEFAFGGTRRVSFTLLGAVAVVLMVATVNLTGLLLTRSVRRGHEMAVRVAIGAGRRRLLGEIATEGLFLGAFGAAVGLIVSVVTARVFVTLAPAALLRADQVQTDATVLSFGLAVTTLCTLAASVIPALRATRTSAFDSMKQQSKAGSRLRRAGMIAAQAALVTIILVGAGLLLGSAWNLTRLPLGFIPTGVATVELIVPSQWTQDNDRRRDFEYSLRERIAALPGVTQASASADVPMSAGSRIGVVPQGATGPQMTTVMPVDENFLPLIQVPLVQGRGILSTDTGTAPRVALVNRAFVRKHWPHVTPLGRRLQLSETHEIVGVVEDVVELTDGKTRLRGLVPASTPAVYVPIQQFRMGRITYLSAHSPVPLSSAALAAAVRESAPEVTIRKITYLDELVRAATIETRFYAAVLLLFGGISLALAAVGVFGVVSQSVNERRREFGVRLALGATPGRLLLMVLTHTSLALSLGAVVGAVLASQFTWMLKAWLFGVRPTDPTILATVMVGLVCTGILSAWRPARAASLADPIKALRAE